MFSFLKLMLYAGGITSAALDGLKTAIKIMEE